MSLLGKVLAVLNLLGALGLTYLVALDYGARLKWQHAVFLADLTIKGLPLSAEDLDKQGSKPVVDDVTGDMRRKLFKDAGQPVSTQVEEVKRVRELLEKRIREAGDPQKEVAVYARILLPLASSNLQRETLLALQYYLADLKTADALKKQLNDAVAAARKQAQEPDSKLKLADALAIYLRTLPGASASPFTRAVLEDGGKKPVDQVFRETVEAEHEALKKQFEGLFDGAVATKTEGKERPQDEQRAAIAHLLFNVVGAEAEQPLPARIEDIYELEAYRRFFAVVGLEAGVKEISSQALVLADIQRELNDAIARDQSTFALTQAQLLGQAQELAEKVDRSRTQVARVHQQAVDQAKLVNRRKQDVAAAEEDLAAARKISAERFKELTDMRKALFNIRLAARDATTANQDRVRKIADLEDQFSQ